MDSGVAITGGLRKAADCACPARDTKRPTPFVRNGSKAESRLVELQGQLWATRRHEYYIKEAANWSGLVSLPSENPGIEDGRYFENRPNSIADLDSKALIQTPFDDCCTGCVHESIKRHLVRRFGVRQIHAFRVS